MGTNRSDHHETTARGDIVYVGAEPFSEGIFSRSQAIAIELARSFRVLYVNFPFNSAPHLLYDRLSRKPPQHHTGLRLVQPNLWTADFVKLLPGFLTAADNRVNVRIIAQQLNRAIRSLRFEKSILWMATTWAASIVKEIPASAVCYDCMDNIAALHPGALGRVFGRLEEKALQTSDLVIASSEELYAKCQKFNQQVHLVRNGVRADSFPIDGAPLPADLRALERPILGYIGSVGHWLDVDLLRALALGYPRSSVVIVGPVDTQVDKVSGLPNVHFLGRKSIAEVPRYVSGFDVCLIPFRYNELTSAVNPIKFYEYCAAGRPTVSISLPELRRYREICYLASSQEEFLGAVGQAMRERQIPHLASELARARRTVAEENTWSLRGKQIEEILARLREHRNASDNVE